MLTVDQIRAFLAERPLLTQRGLSLEAGISDSLLGKILRGNQGLTQSVSDKLEPILVKYGFK
jgi:DNA transposition AAA+ family ATPase